MKKQKINAKLSLGKETLTRLTNQQSAAIAGGFKTESNNGSCWMGHTCSGPTPLTSGNTCANSCIPSCAC